MTDTTKLPPLPETRYVIGIESDGYSDARITSRPAWDDDMVRGYGAECRRMALDEVAQAIDRGASALFSNHAKTAADYVAHGLLLKLLSGLSSAIRAMKDEA